MNLIDIYKSDTNRGILLRWTVNILVFCAFIFFALQISEWGSSGPNGGPDSSVVEH